MPFSADPPGALVARQLAAVDAFHRARREAERAARSTATSREARMDAARRLEVLRVQHAAVVERGQAALTAGTDLLRTAPAARAVVAHRQDWFADKACVDLDRRRIAVLGRYDNGAALVGVAVAEQPDLVLLEDRLAMLAGEELVRALRTWAPDAVLGVQVAAEERAGALLEAGATAVFSRRLPPADVCAELVGLLEQRVLQDV